jgi:hypothetical protein
MRVLCFVGLLVAACAPPYRLAVQDQYEVGEDPTIAVAVRETSKQQAILIITRPDGSTVHEMVSLAGSRNNVRFGRPPARGIESTFTMRGDYRVELRDDKAVLAKQEIRVAVDRLTALFEESEIADFARVARYTRSRSNRHQRWKTYGALYEHTFRGGVQIQVTIEEPGDALRDAWKPFEEEGTLSVIENHTVRFRERNDSVSASWVSGKRIIALRGQTLADFEPGFMRAFLQKHPSELDER